MTDETPDPEDFAPSPYYELREAFDTIGRRFVPGWTGKEWNALETRDPETILPKLKELQEQWDFTTDKFRNSPTEGAEIRQFLPGGQIEVAPLEWSASEAFVERAEHVARKLDALKRDLEMFRLDPEAFKAEYNAWRRRNLAVPYLDNAIKNGHVPAWLLTIEQDKHLIVPEHWGDVLSGFWYRLESGLGGYKQRDGSDKLVGEILIDRAALDQLLANSEEAEPTKSHELTEDERADEAVLNEPGTQTNAEIDVIQDGTLRAEQNALDGVDQQKNPDQVPYPNAKRYPKPQPTKPLSKWLDPIGRSNEFNYHRMSRMLDIWKHDPGQEYLFVKLGSKAKIVEPLKENCATRNIPVPADTQIRDFVTAWLVANAPDWYWQDG